MIHQIKDFKIGDTFKIGGKFANIYKGKTFKVYKNYGTYLMAHGFDHKGINDGVEYAFDQTNFDGFKDAVKRV